jgi:Rod binding domain-containing protein
MQIKAAAPTLTPSTLALSLSKGLPVNPTRDEAKRAAKAGSDFEALLVTRMLKTARAAKLGDDLMGKNDQIRDLIDETRARSLTAAAPLGLAQLLAREAKR